MRWTAVWALSLLLACEGSIIGPRADDTDDRDPNRPYNDDEDPEDPIVRITPPGTEPAPDHVAVSGLRRLSPTEYDHTVEDLLGVLPRASGEVLPSDQPPHEEEFPFDNAYAHQAPSQSLIGGAETLAFEIVDALSSDRPQLESLVPCSPSGPGDAECARTFVEQFGRRAFRRPLSDEEVGRFVDLVRCPAGSADSEYCGFGVEEGDFYFGIETVIAAMLVHPNFLYRVEVGTPTGDGAFELNGYEVATRLSYFLWGTTPDDWLLDQAAAGALTTEESVRDIATTMIDDPRGHRQVQRMHAMWLHYEHIGMEGPLADDMRRETEALIERVVFEERLPWKEIFTFPETFVTAELAEHYGLDEPGNPEGAWVDYGSSGRGGILSHGSFLTSVGAAGEDTSPVDRGKFVTTILVCQPIKLPPVNIPDPPAREEVECKQDIFTIHAEGSCAGCHQFMDPIGFGLEGFDREGAFRTEEESYPECEITGEGTFPSPTGFDDPRPFNGPAELGAIVTEGDVQACAALQMYRYAMGHNVRRAVDTEGLNLEDFPFVAWLASEFGLDGRFDELLLDIVTSQAFLQRRDECPAGVTTDTWTCSEDGTARLQCSISGLVRETCQFGCEANACVEEDR